MDYLLVTNDDGVDSPSVLPLLHALARVAPVRAVFPDRERSWIGKAITRYDELEVQRLEVEGLELYTASGYPADCVQLGMHTLFDDRPALVVSGINIGYNFGSAFVAGSGTVGAAAEGALAGIPALAFSAGTSDAANFREWREAVMRPESRPDWERVAEIAADVVARVLKLGFPLGVDVLSVNVPFTADASTPRRVTRLARTRYDGLFERNGDGSYIHAFRGGIHRLDEDNDTDLDIAARNEISITPIVLPASVELPAEVRSPLEDPG